MQNPLRIPLFIPLARERVASFRREVEMVFSGEYNDTNYDAIRAQLREVVRPFRTDDLDLIVAPPINLVAVADQALVWASSRPMATVSELRKARILFESILSDWEVAWTPIARLSRSHFGELLNDVTTVAMLNHQYAANTIASSWPTESEESEMKRLKEMKDGQSVGLEEAFAGIAGISTEEWLERVAKHSDRRQTKE